jgi:hypothetical protein
MTITARGEDDYEKEICSDGRTIGYSTHRMFFLSTFIR